MYAAPGIGLAAIQVGILKRLVVIDISKDKEKRTIVSHKSWNIREIRNHFNLRRRVFIFARTICWNWKTRECFKIFRLKWNQKKLKASGLLSTCIQHEVDHLNGVLFIDYLSKLKKDMIIKKLVKHKKEIEKIIV